MELYALRHGCQLLPCYDDDAEKLKSIRDGQPVLVTIAEARSIRFHRKYFALVSTAWECLDGRWRIRFRENLDNFRRTLTLLAGFTDQVYRPSSGEWLEVPRSISFERMSEAEFRQLYNATLNVLCEQFLPEADGRREALLNELAHF